MKSVYATRRIPEGGLRLLREKGLAVDVSPHDRPLTRDELLAAARGREALLTQLVDKVDEGVLDAAGPSLKVVANYAVGYDNVDVRAASARGVVVTNTPGVLTDATAELAWALLLAAARRVPEGHEMTRAGKFTGWAPMLLLGRGVTGKTLGVVGAGRIGRAFARLSKGFGMRVLYWSRTPCAEMERELGARKTDLDALLKESDFVSLHVSLTPETRRLIGARELDLMKPTAVLVNTARGPVVDEAALVDALKRGPRSGRGPLAAGLDVYEREPALAAGLADLPNVVLAPHAGSATVEAREQMAVLAAENIVEVLEGRPAKTPVKA